MIKKLLVCKSHRAPEWLTFKRNRFSSSQFQQNFIELILWVLLVCVALYVYTPTISSFSASLFTQIKKIEYDSSNPYQLSEMKLTVQLVLQTSGNGSISEILANHSSGPYIVPPKFRERFEHDLSDEFQDITEIHSNNPSAVTFRETLLAIVCRAPFAIELAYEGPAAPRFGYISIERKYRHAATLTHTFYEVILHFNKYELEEVDTGRYICQATEKQNRTNGLKNKKTRGFIDIFVPGEMKLLHNGLWNDHGLLGGAAAASPIIVYYDVGRGGKEITLPCGVSHPQTKVSLYHKETKLLAFENKGGIVFDALQGFRIPFKLIENLLQANSDYNQFACKIKGGIQEMLFNIVIKDATKSHVSPSSSLVAVGEGQLPVQLFVCEADEPVMIRWLDGPPAVTLKEETKNESYKLSFIATPMQYSYTKDSMSRIQCSRKRDGMIIHVWEWVGNGVAEPFLRYNRKRKELSCCMNSAQSPPQLVVIACSTMLECQVKGSFQPKIAAGGSNGVSNNAGCSVWTVPTSFQAGVILCNQVNSNPFRDLSPNKEFPPVFFKWNDDVVVISKQISSQPLQDLITMKLSSDVGRMGYKQVKIECLASTFVSAKGLRWTMHAHNGDVVDDLQFKQSWGGDTLISYQEDYSLKTATVHGTLLFRSTAISPKPFLEIKGNEEGIAELSKMDVSTRIAYITCEAPLWNATDAWIYSTVYDVGL